MKLFHFFSTLFIAIFVTFLVTNNASAETWERTFGGAGWDGGYSVQQTNDGGYIIVGTTYSFGAGAEDVYLIKTDVNGNYVWGKTFGGSNDDEGESVKQTNDGGYIIVGETKSFGAGDSDVYLIKTNADGSRAWSKTFGGSEGDRGSSVQQTTDGGYIIVGSTASFGLDGQEIYLIKTDASGDHVWSKTFGVNIYNWGGYVQQTTDGGYFIVGSGYGSLSEINLYIIKTYANGNMEWSDTVLVNVWDPDVSTAGQQTSDGGYVAAIPTYSSVTGSTELYLRKMDTNGDEQWTRTIGVADWCEEFSLQQSSDYGYIITGSTCPWPDDVDVQLIKADANGYKAWGKTFGGSNDDWGSSVQQTDDGGYIIVGSTSSFGVSENDVYLIYYKPEAALKATNPNPSNGSTDIPTITDISWSDGGGATSYDVYLGTDPSPDNGEFKGNQTSTTYDPGRLDPNTTYYWRIDAKSEFGTTTGDVWSFTTQSAQAMPWIPLLLMDDEDTTPAAGKPQSLFVGYPSAQAGDSNPVGFTYATPFFSAVNKHGRGVDAVQIKLTRADDPNYASPIWSSGNIPISSLGNGDTSSVPNNGRIPDIFFGMGNHPIALLEHGNDYLWKVRTKAGANYSDWSSDGMISMTPAGTMTARFYEDKDTFYSTVYHTDGMPDSNTLSIGGWGDWYYIYMEWDLTLAPPSANTISCNIFLYCQYARVNDPFTKIRRITSPWTEAGVTYWNHPTDTPDGQIDMSYPAAEEQYHVTDITSIYGGWVAGSYDNYGLKLHPTTNNHTGGSFYSEDQQGIDKDPYLEVTYQAQ